MNNATGKPCAGSPSAPQQEMMPLIFYLQEKQDLEEDYWKKSNPLKNLPIGQAWFFKPEIHKVNMNNRTFEMRNTRSAIPSCDEIPSQMSPFCDDRWELDVEENRKRREIHREYVYNLNQRKPPPQQLPFQDYVVTKPQKHDTIVQYPPVVADVPEPPPKPQCESEKKDFLKYEPPKVSSMKRLAEIQFDTPGPPNLFPVLKFPEKKINPDSVYRLSDASSIVPPLAGASAPVGALNLPPRPEFSTYKDIKFEREKVLHYGVHVPFWQFSSKSNLPS